VVPAVAVAGGGVGERVRVDREDGVDLAVDGGDAVQVRGGETGSTVSRRPP
jgi:hypothetical protein